MFTGPDIVTDGLVLALDAGSKKSYPGSGTTVYDLSGYGNNGTMVNNVYHNGSAFVFDGNIDYITCGSDTSLDITDAITLTAWVNANSIAANGHVIGKAQYGNGYILHHDAVYEGPSGGGFQTTNVDNEAFEWGQNITINKWYYVCYTYDGSTERGYYNDTLINSKSNPGSISSNAASDLKIGMNSSDCWNGQIAIVNIYNKALTAQEVLQNYNATKSRFNL